MPMSLEAIAASIVVAPFREGPEEPDARRLANGFLEDVIAELARFPGAGVLHGQLRASDALRSRPRPRPGVHSPDLDAGDPEQLGREYRELTRACCGTDDRHVRAIGSAWG
jgi:hypothetical protein